MYDISNFYQKKSTSNDTSVRTNMLLSFIEKKVYNKTKFNYFRVLSYY
jgi:hypothetical protein